MKKTDLRVGFTIAELLLVMLIVMIVAAAIAPVVGVKRVKAIRHNPIHGVYQCFYTWENNKYVLHSYYQDNKKNRGGLQDKDKDGNNTIINDGKSCQFKIARDVVYALSGVGAGSPGTGSGSFVTVNESNPAQVKTYAQTSNVSNIKSEANGMKQDVAKGYIVPWDLYNCLNRNSKDYKQCDGIPPRITRLWLDENPNATLNTGFSVLSPLATYNDCPLSWTEVINGESKQVDKVCKPADPGNDLVGDVIFALKPETDNNGKAISHIPTKTVEKYNDAEHAIKSIEVDFENLGYIKLEAAQSGGAPYCNRDTNECTNGTGTGTNASCSSDKGWCSQLSSVSSMNSDARASYYYSSGMGFASNIFNFGRNFSLSGLLNPTAKGELLAGFLLNENEDHSNDPNNGGLCDDAAYALKHPLECTTGGASEHHGGSGGRNGGNNGTQNLCLNQAYALANPELCGQQNKNNRDDDTKLLLPLEKGNKCDLASFREANPCICIDGYAANNPCICNPNYAEAHKCECDNSYAAANKCECDEDYANADKNRCECHYADNICDCGTCDDALFVTMCIPNRCNESNEKECEDSDYADGHPRECGLCDDPDFVKQRPCDCIPEETPKDCGLCGNKDYYNSHICACGDCSDEGYAEACNVDCSEPEPDPCDDPNADPCVCTPGYYDAHICDCGNCDDPNYVKNCKPNVCGNKDCDDDDYAEQHPVACGLCEDDEFADANDDTCSCDNPEYMKKYPSLCEGDQDTGIDCDKCSSDDDYADSNFESCCSECSTFAIANRDYCCNYPDFYSEHDYCSGCSDTDYLMPENYLKENCRFYNFAHTNRCLCEEGYAAAHPDRCDSCTTGGDGGGGGGGEIVPDGELRSNMYEEGYIRYGVDSYYTYKYEPPLVNYQFGYKGENAVLREGIFEKVPEELTLIITPAYPGDANSGTESRIEYTDSEGHVVTVFTARSGITKCGGGTAKSCGDGASDTSGKDYQTYAYAVEDTETYADEPIPSVVLNKIDPTVSVQDNFVAKYLTTYNKTGSIGAYYKTNQFVLPGSGGTAAYKPLRGEVTLQQGAVIYEAEIAGGNVTIPAKAQQNDGKYTEEKIDFGAPDCTVGDPHSSAMGVTKLSNNVCKAGSGTPGAIVLEF